MITIQKATPEHLDTLILFQQQLAFESENIELSSDDLRKGLMAMFQDTSKGIYYLAFHKEEVIGCHMITTEWSDWRNGMVWWLQSVYVKQTYRKMGVFSKMFENVMSLISNDPTLIGLRLYVDKTNTKAMKAYESMGMDGSHYTVYEKMK